MKKTFAVLRREFVSRVRTRTFVLATVLFPVMIVMFAVLPALLSRGGNRTLRMAILDGSNDSLGTRVASALQHEKLTSDTHCAPLPAAAV